MIYTITIVIIVGHLSRTRVPSFVKNREKGDSMGNYDIL